MQAGRQYDFHIVAQTAGEIELTVALTDRGGKRVYAQQTVRICGAEWERYHAVLNCIADDGDADLRVTFCGKGCLDIGALSLMPTDHFRGMRRDVIEALKTLGVRVLRWPGGNFAGEYNWFDGLLPVDMRAPFASYLGLETQAHTMGFDYHEINTDDFIALCREIGAEPYLTINLTWNTAQENAAWVEYCNGDATTKYGKLRAERGHAEPYGVKLWTLGNEFGYGHMEGDNSPQGYCRLAQESGAKMLEVTEDLIFCSSGPHPDADWVKHAAKPLAPISSLVSLHYYTPSPSYVNEEEAEEEFLTCMGSVQTARNAVHRLRELLGESDIGISFDEWNTWYAWYRPSCVVDGLFTAAMLHMIIGEAAHYRIDVSCHFEAINEGLIEVSPHGAVLTAAGQAFAMMKHHIDGELCHASDAAVVTRREDVLTVTLLNTAYRGERTFTLPAVGEVLGATLYRADELIPHTTFTPTELSVQVQEGRGAVTLPAHSMAMIQFRLPSEM